jgi:hypothetical protein
MRGELTRLTSKQCSSSPDSAGAVFARFYFGALTAEETQQWQTGAILLRTRFTGNQILELPDRTDCNGFKKPYRTPDRSRVRTLSSKLTYRPLR